MSTSSCELPNYLVVSVDPGAVRTGVAVYWPDHPVVTCTTHDPWGAVCEVVALLNNEQVDCVVIEKWVPYPHASSGNAWRTITELLCSGAIEWECRQRNVTYVYQPTELLTPTEALADGRGYEWQAEDRDQKSAETHLYHYLHLRKGNRT